MNLTPATAAEVVRVAGGVLEAELNLDIDIAADGSARVVYRHRICNIGTSPTSRIAREVWFKHTSSPLRIVAVDVGGPAVVIRRLHDTPNLAKFACQISPAILPGETATIEYAVDGGLFLDEFYWRQATPRYVHRFDIRVRHRGAGRLIDCTAVEEHADGSESSATEQLRWDHVGGDVIMTLGRDRLRPNQAVTLRWDVSEAAQ